MTRRIFITIEYDGTPFVGWQRQVTGLSVQQVLERRCCRLPVRWSWSLNKSGIRRLWSRDQHRQLPRILAFCQEPKKKR